MRIDLPNIHTVKKRLSDGREKRYYYHRLTRRRITGEPGTPEFIESYHAAALAGAGPAKGTLAAIIHDFKRSPQFAKLAPRTRRDYDGHLLTIRETFGDAPFAVLEDRRFRKLALDERDRIARASPKRADYYWAVLRRILSWAVDRGQLAANVCTGGGKLYHPDRRANVWTEAHIAAFMAAAPAALRLAMTLALYTGQRQGDLLALKWSAWDGKALSLTQQKTGARVTIPAVSILREALDAAPRSAVTILTTTRGAPWTPNGFRSAWRNAARRAGVSGLTFHDLRGTCLTMLAEAGCTEAEIAAISGHKTAHAGAMKGYIHHGGQLAASAIEKLEIWLQSRPGAVYISPASH